MRRILLTFLFLGVSAPLFAQSPLADGQILKLRIAEGGVYKITYNQLRDAGIPVESLNPDNFQLFGFGGGILSQANAAYNLNEPLPERAIRLVGAEDGSFDPSDYVLFYADEPYNLTFDTENELIHHEAALYDDFNYYFLKVGTQSTGKRIADANLSTTGGQVVNTYNAMHFHETDEYNILASIRRAPGGSGRQWFGEIFDFTPSQDFTFDLSGHASGTPVSVTTRAYGYGFTQTHYEVVVNDLEVDRLAIAPSVEATYTQKGRATESTGGYAGEVSEEFVVNLTYQKGNTSGLGFLDFMEVNFTRNLEWQESQTPFYTFGLLRDEVYTFQFSNPENKAVEIWEIGDPQHAKFVTEGNEARLDFSMLAPEVPRFIAFDQAEVPQTEVVGQVTNQNLLGVTTPNLLIVTPSIFKAAAERLAEFRRTADGLSVEVVELSQIYNTFSSGRQDITAIRNFIRSLYLKSSEELRYVLLFGDASYDPKNRTDNNTNFIPIYQSRDSFDPIYSFSSDDYFAFMEAFEGEWAENASGNSHTLDLGIGRLPVQTQTQARQVVDKLISYYDTAHFGKWRNRILFVADDGDRNIHQNDSERLTEIVDENFPAYNTKRLYVDAFPQTPDENGVRRSPEARETLNQAIEQGAFIVNFMGHGSEAGWTSESILDVATIQRWRNPKTLPLFVTATCEFGRYDNPLRESGGERILLSPGGGGVALITTTRPVFANTNFRAARAFYENVFTDNSQRLGDIMRKTKNESLTLVNRNFALLGDPSMRLAYPEAQVRLSEKNILLSPLERVRLTGEVVQNDVRQNDFSGTLDVTVFNVPKRFETLGDESAPTTYTEYSEVIFSGQVNVSEGQFSISFVTPADLSATEAGTGKISLYAQTTDQTRDAHGATLTTVGGENLNPIPDGEAPTTQLFLEDENFVSGDRVPQNVLLLAKLSDDLGFNLLRDVVVILDEDEAQPILLTDYFQSAVDNPSSGSIAFPLQNLPLGEHTLTLRAYDTHNNLAEATISFFVIEEDLKISDGLAYPNPVFSDETVRFDFSHNREGEDLEVTLEIFSRLGQLVYRQSETVLNAPETLDLLKWQPNSNSVHARGFYVYRLRVMVTETGETGQKTGKIIEKR